MDEFPLSPRSHLRSISYRLHGGWISDSDYLGELSLLCNEVSFICLLIFDGTYFMPFYALDMFTLFFIMSVWL